MKFTVGVNIELLNINTLSGRYILYNLYYIMCSVRFYFVLLGVINLFYLYLNETIN